MKYGRTYNFSAGPAMMPEEVLEEIAAEVMNYQGSGMSVMEMSHRSKVFQQIRDEAEADLRKLMGIPENYKVLFVQGGGTVQFAMVPMNLMKNGVACYVETGAWTKKAIKEAKKYGEVKIVASSADKNFSYIPDCSDLDIPDNADYVYICENETINGTTYHTLPDTKGKILVADQSSMFLSRPCNVSRLRPDLGRRAEERRPRRHGHRHHPGGSDPGGSAGIRSHLPPLQDPRRRRLPLQHPQLLGHLLLRQGVQVPAGQRRSGGHGQAQRGEGRHPVRLPGSAASSSPALCVKEDRSLMNVPFVSPSKEQDAEVVAATKAAGFDNLKGHKSVGGLRASIYNAMPKEGVEALVDFLKKYEEEHA